MADIVDGNRVADPASGTGHFGGENNSDRYGGDDRDNRFSGTESEAAVRGAMIADQIGRGFHPTTATERVENGYFDTFSGMTLASSNDVPEEIDPRFGLTDDQAAVVDLISKAFGLQSVGQLASVLDTTTQTIIAKATIDLAPIAKRLDMKIKDLPFDLLTRIADKIDYASLSKTLNLAGKLSYALAGVSILSKAGFAGLVEYQTTDSIIDAAAAFATTAIKETISYAAETAAITVAGVAIAAVVGAPVAVAVAVVGVAYGIGSVTGFNAAVVDLVAKGWNGELQGENLGIPGFEHTMWSQPIVLDLDGAGISLTQKSSSNQFFDISGDGYQHRTAWAGTGDGVLAIDADGDGKITERKEIVFTDWDPSAKDDMAALRSVFDTNNNGKLDSGDAEFSKFRVVVTNADGTTSVKTLADAGVESINLITDSTEYTLPDGSSVNGMTTYDKVGGGTGKAAAVTFAADSQGYAVENGTVVNPDGSTTITNTARNADGSVANVTVTKTSADGNNRTITFDYDGDGVVDKVQTIEKVLDGDGSRTETITNRNGGNVLLDSTETKTSADGNTVTISRDTRGGDYFNETETRVTTAGVLTITLSKLNPDESLISQKITTTTADGLTRTESYNLDGKGTPDLIVTEATVVHGDGSRTETVTTKSGDGSKLLSKTVTDIDAAGEDRTIVSDVDGDGDTDLTTTVNVDNMVDGSTVTTETRKNFDNSVRGQKVTSISSDSLTYVTKVDIDGDGTFDLTRNDVTVINGGGSRTQTITETNADGSLRDKTIIVKGADGRGRDIQIDRDGDGVNDHTRTIVIAGNGSSVDTVTELNRDGSISSKSVTSSSADGLTITTQLDADGDGTYETVYESKTDRNGDGSATITETTKNDDTTLRSKSVTKVSADGLSITTELDRDGNDTVDLTRSDDTVLKVDGSYEQTVTDRFNNNAVGAKSVTTTSADRNTIEAIRDLNGDGATDQTESIARQANGDVVDTVINKAINGSTINKLETTTSANGLSTTVKFDQNGDNTFDRTTTKVTTLEADGDQVTVTTDKAGTSQIAKVTQTVSGNGLSVTSEYDINGDNTVDRKTTDVTDLNTDGSRTRTVSEWSNSNSLISQLVTKVSDDGLSTTIDLNLDGDSDIDLTSTDATVLKADGSTTRTISNTNVHGLRDQSVTTTSADGRTVTGTAIANGSVNTKQAYTRAIADNGNVIERVSNLGTADALLNRIKTTTAANGLSVTKQTDQNGDGVFDYASSSVTTLNTNGSRKQTVTNTNSAGLINKSVTTVSGNGLSTTVESDRDGDGIFDLTTTSVRTLNADGSVKDTVTETSANNTEFSKTITTTTGDQKTVTINRYLSGANVQNETRALQTNGDTIATVTSKKADGAPLSTVTTTTSANGLSKTVQTKNAAGNVVDTQTTTIALNANGSRTESFTQTQAGGVNSTINTTTSADGLSVSQTKVINGAISRVFDTSDQTVLNADGSRTQTVTVTNSSNVLKDKAVITTSDDGLSRTATLDVDGDSTDDNTYTSVTDTDGSKVETAIYNKLTGGLRRKEVTSTSVDGRTVTYERDADGNGNTDLTITTVRNADGSITETRVGAALGGVQAYSQVSKTEIDLDGGVKIVSEYFNGSGTLTGRTTTSNAANGLSQTVLYDVNGDGTSDKRSTKTVTIAANGETTETERISLIGGVTSSTRVVIRSADGSVTTTTLDLDGNGINEQSSVTTLRADGSIFYEFKTFDNDTGTLADTQSVTIGVNGRQLSKSTYETIVASLQLGKPYYVWENMYTHGQDPKSITRRVEKRDTEVVYTVQKNTTLDTMTLFAGTDGDNQWVRTINGTQVAKSLHTIDANNVETWTWNITNTTLWNQNSSLPFLTASGSIQIDTATRDLYLERAGNIFSAALSREMGADERETLPQYIKTDGTLDEKELAKKILASAEYTGKYGTMNNTQFVTRLYINAFGYRPSATMRDYYVNQLTAGTMIRADVLVALGLGIESGQVTRSEWLNGTIDDGISYLTATAGVTVNLSDTTKNAGGALKDDFVLVKDVVGSSFNDTLTGNDKKNRLVGGAGNDKLDGGAGADLLYGGAGNDTLTGGDGTDTVSYGTEGAAVTVDLSTGTATGATVGTDTLSTIENVTGSAYNDTLIGDDGANALAGNAGEDILKGGLGNDTYRFYRGDGQDEVFDVENYWTLQSKNVSTGTKTLNNSYSYNTWEQYDEPGQDSGTAWRLVTKTVPVSMQVGTYKIVKDPLEVHTNAGTNDVLQFYSGITKNDLAFEFRGNDLYIGVKDASKPGAKASALDDSIRLVNWLDPLDRVETLKFDDGTTISVASFVGTIPGAPTYTAVNGTANADTLTGGTGRDSITGGAGNDQLAGGKGDDRLEGGKGDDTYVFARGDAWDVILDENKYINTTTTTQSYTDTYDKTYSYTYYDKVASGSGGDITYSYVQKTGSKTVTFTDSGSRTVTTNQYKVDSGGTDTLSFAAGITVEDVAVKVHGDDLLIVLRDSGNPAASFWELTDRLRIENWSDTKYRVEKFQFDGGTIIDVASMIAADTGGEGNDVITGDGATNWLAGSGGNDTLQGMGGDDVLIGGSGDDLLVGGAGADRLYGGAGSDTADYSASASAVAVDLAAGTAAGGDAAGDVLNSIENLIGSAGNDALTGDSAGNRLVGGGGDDLLDGGGGNDTLEGGAGNDTLTGGTGADLYQMGRGGGADQITASLSDSSADQLTFTGNVDHDQLWFKQSGDDLVISIIGTTDSMTVKGWYTAGNDRLDRIAAGDGDYLDSSDVDVLVTAMASLTEPSLGQTKLPAQQQQQLSPALAASWHPG